MDRDKRRSKEEEEELDRKIALIREKNQKIEQRSREVEADRAQNADATPKKPSQAPQHHQPPKTGGKGTKTKTWDREWDQGKTPADTWRENVPSIEHSGRLASAQPQQKNHRKGQQQNKPNDPTNRGGRLEGRVSYANEKPAKGKGNEGGRKEGGRQVQQNKSGELVISVKPIPEGHGRGGEHGRGDHARGERQGRRQRGNSEKKTQEPAEKEMKPEDEVEKGQKQKKRRPRRENDKYAVKVTMMRLLDRVEKLERRRKRDEAKENQKQDEPVEDKQKTDDGATPFEEKQSPVTPIVEKPEAIEKIDDPKPEEPPKEQESVKEENAIQKEPDANQNVITLTKERVLTVQMAT